MAGNRIETARKRLGQGNHKGALQALWTAEADFRASPEGLRDVLALAEQIRLSVDGRTAKDADLLIQQVQTNLRARPRAERYSARACIGFPSMNEAHVQVLTQAPSELGKEAEAVLFCLYGAHQITHLLSIDAEDAVGALSDWLADLQGDPRKLYALLDTGILDIRAQSRPPDEVNFEATLSHGRELKGAPTLSALIDDVSFSLELKGVDRTGLGFSYRASSSVMVLLAELASRRQGDFSFCRGLAVAATSLGLLGRDGGIGLVYQVAPALRAAVTGLNWNHEGVIFVEPESASETNGSATFDAAFAIARERYARGEISRDEYKRIEADLLGH